jgi:hypothetical protein
MKDTAMVRSEQPWLSVIIPTIGRRSLQRTIDSLRGQVYGSTIEVLVVADTHQAGGLGPTRTRLPGLPDVADRFRYTRDLAESYGCVYAEHDGGENCWGHPQRDHGARLARGTWLWWLQDDDIAAPDALPAMRSILTLNELRSWAPHLFRVQTWQAGLVWKTEGVLAEKQIDADCIVVPNEPSELVPWGRRYNGDWDFISQMVANYGGPAEVVWDPTIIAIGRPQD